MGKMRNAVSGAEKALKEFQHHHADDKPFGFDRDKEIQINVSVGKHHAEGQQQRINGTRSTHRYVIARNQHADQACAKATNQIVEQETLRPPYVFKRGAEHPQWEHVEKEMLEIAVHEHIGKRLPNAEHPRIQRPNPEPEVQVDISQLAQHKIGQKTYTVDN